jgi:large subunit ribosomal protein L23
MDYTQILIKPLVSEKASLAKDTANQVVFFVNPAANKIEIRRAVEEAFKVEVTNVNVVRRAPTLKKKFGKVQGKIAGYKKAYVTLVAGHKIEFFEGV